VARSVLFCRAGRRRFALPALGLIETLRPASIERLPDTPPFVLGASEIRGIPTLVLSVAELLGTGWPPARHFVTLDVSGRAFTLAVDELGGTGELSCQTLAILPALVSATRGEVAAAIRNGDPQLYDILEEARLIPRQLWRGLTMDGPP
jgi:purine-binding chemotaxis protein CheW